MTDQVAGTAPLAASRIATRCATITWPGETFVSCCADGPLIPFQDDISIAEREQAR
jgi:hypothetical protein